MVGRMEELLLGSEQVGWVVQAVQRVEEVHLQGIKNREEERMTSLAVWLNCVAPSQHLQLQLSLEHTLGCC